MSISRGSFGAGSSTKTASVVITDDNNSGLPAAPTWSIVATSSNTQLKGSIAAAVGDRIRVYGRFMYTGSRFLDWVVLNSSNAVSIYLGSGTSTPLSEGDPAIYPSTSFPHESAPQMFTVTSGQLNAGNVTVALYNQGSSTATVYASATYPWKLRLENIGPEPS